jgi:hypothetical protein
MSDKNNKPLKVAAYCRVATPEQAKGFETIEQKPPLLTADEITIDPELMIEYDHINASIGTWFDVDEKFGTQTHGTDDWVNFYADYYPTDGRLEACYILNHADGSDSDPVPVELADSERDIILEMMREQGLDECILEMQQEEVITMTGIGG